MLVSKLVCSFFTQSFVYLLGVRSLANASRARQFNRLNPPGVGWVNCFSFFKVRVSIRKCVPNLGAVRRERFLTIDRRKEGRKELVYSI